jgi:transcription elongation factor GreA
MKKILFTKEKYKENKNKYRNLLTERKDAVMHLSRARAMGDLSENGYYKSSKSKLISIDHDIRRLSNFIKYGSVINFVNRGVAGIGCTATIKTKNNTKKYKIVGKEEANPREGKISNESPLGIAILHKKVGDSVEFITPSGKISYKIIKIDMI